MIQQLAYTCLFCCLFLLRFIGDHAEPPRWCPWISTTNSDLDSFLSVRNRFCNHFPQSTLEGKTRLMPWSIVLEENTWSTVLELVGITLSHHNSMFLVLEKGGESTGGILHLGSILSRISLQMQYAWVFLSCFFTSLVVISCSCY